LVPNLVPTFCEFACLKVRAPSMVDETAGEKALFVTAAIPKPSAATPLDVSCIN
jgi:hypothetical protein